MANKIGDISLLMVCVYIHLLYKTLDFSTLFLVMDTTNHIIYPSNVNTTMPYIVDGFLYLGLDSYFQKVICFLLIIAAVGKSAQAGFHI